MFIFDEMFSNRILKDFQELFRKANVNLVFTAFEFVHMGMRKYCFPEPEISHSEDGCVIVSWRDYRVVISESERATPVWWSGPYSVSKSDWSDIFEDISQEFHLSKV